MNNYKIKTEQKSQNLNIFSIYSFITYVVIYAETWVHCTDYWTLFCKCLLFTLMSYDPKAKGKATRTPN